MDLQSLTFAVMAVMLSVCGLSLALDMPRLPQAHLGFARSAVVLSASTEPASTPQVTPAAAPAILPTIGAELPIVYYHYTPPDFGAQLDHLAAAGYTVIDLDQAIAGLEGGAMPAKPVVITFDDGFANQMDAFAILKQRQTKATFYIVNAGPKSLWCIGAGRRYQDPLQPPQGCGDAYLTWDQVRELDRSGLITIGGHTMDHSNLAALSVDEQRAEIADSKAGIEREIGHSIKHFAYPYGGYTAATIDLVREAGFVSAVSTIAGTYQPAGERYALRRVHSTFELP